jgi:aminoglycoside phosphotransferase family enzyme/predicted kinase
MGQVSPADYRPVAESSSSSEPPEIHETHTGIVILLGDRAYKVKKPVVTDFLDFSTLQSRARVCEREVVLNSRLAPDSYLGVGHFHGPRAGEGEPIVLMRRYSDRIRLSSMVRRGEPVEQHLAALAKLLASFHADADRFPVIDTCGSLSSIASRWHANLAELERLPHEHKTATLIGEIRHLAMRYLSGRAALFAQRIAAGRIVDGHGDLLADDIFCTDAGPAPLDCLEFDDQLRYLDGVDDSAFLAMDLEYLGRPDLARFFMDYYRASAQDPAPQSLIDFYVAYRALVRAKVDFIRGAQGCQDAHLDALNHFRIAHTHLRQSTVRLIIVGGGPGTGKTTLATSLAKHLEAELLSTDSIRRELHQSGVITGSVHDLDAGIYHPGQVDAVYDEVLKRAGEALAGGRSVVVDGTWRSERHRHRAADTAQWTSSVLVEIGCITELSVAQQRIASRAPTTSDATPQIAAEITSQLWPTAYPIDTCRPFADELAEAIEVCESAV